ncbi:hypothetical protein PX554_02875 [Sphingomonas sp. H39-1-10]|uniref:hypothetical protein n=1 Tax=Sphingomonas pollutisoli TaxID=3030829 RepID=UPI0023B9B5A2|nr:hypothetical protein [Sphingomonas pollutisoli]MDF0487062.1 hypothetical protein [Sphingomonas pollutisoli]
MKRLVLAGVLALGGCGSASDLKPASNQHLPVAPYSARATPTATQLLTPPTQARPERSDELLKKSETRRGDEFDLPPHN